MNILFLCVGVAIGCLIGYLLVMQSANKLKTTLLLLEKSATEQKADSEKTIAGLQSTVNRLIEEASEAKAAKAAAEVEIKNLNEKLAGQVAAMESQQERMKMEFQNLSTKILRENSTDFSRISTDSIEKLLAPLSERIKDFRDKVESCYGDEAKERRSLSDEVKRLVEQNQKIGEEATQLSKALKGESKTQGDWGEMILEDILQKSGLKEGEQYFPQDTMHDENGNIIKTETEKAMRPDMVVLYPGKRKIIIDSKVSLTAYADYANAEDAATEQKKLKEHVASVKKHIDELSVKDYSKYIDESPEFVMMFIPNESAYYTALKADDTLWNYAYQKKVLLMNQTNLITALRLALDLWRRDAQERNIREIIQVGSEMYDKFVGFTDTLTDVGKGITNAQTAYDKAIGQLSTGRGNLVRKAHKLKSLGITPKKQLTINADNDEESNSGEEKD